jgi:hypothetical protein
VTTGPAGAKSLQVFDLLEILTEEILDAIALSL